MKLLSLSIVIILFFVGRGTVTPLPLELLDPNDIIQYSDVSYRCPTGYSQPDNSNWNNCYMLYTDHLSRRDAAARCNAENGTLASVGNAFVNAFIYSLATKSGTTWLWLGIQCFNRTDASCVNDDNTPFVYSNFYPGGTGFRIGLECPNTSKKGDISTCVWDDGTPFSYSNFAEGQPVRSANKYCGYSLNGTWYTDSVCNGPYGFLCAVCQAPMMLN